MRTAGSGEEAIRVAQDFAAEVYLVDINLPDINGLDLPDRVRSVISSSSAKFFALSGYDLPEVRSRALEVGFQDFFIKPIDPGKLHEAIVAEGE